MQTQFHPVPAPLVTAVFRQNRPILATVFTIGSLLSATDAGEPIFAKAPDRYKFLIAQASATQEQTRPSEAEAAGKDSTTVPDPAPLAPGEEVSPSDPLLIPELPPLLDPPPEPESRARRETRVTLRGEDLDEAGELDAGEQTDGAAGTFVVPGFYGSAPKEFTHGRGPLLGPRFRASANIGLGYDDNISQGTSGSEGEAVASAFTSVGLNASYRTAGQMQFFAFDAGAGADFYWDQQDPNYNLSLGMSFQRRFVSPVTVTANAGLSYRTQPDYAQVNLVRPTEADEDNGDLGVLSASAKVDLRYAWTAQFSTVTSIAGDTILYGGSRSDADSIDITIGNELRYRVARYTWIGEGRYQFNARPNEEEEESDTVFLLAGVEWRLGPLQISSRLGGTIRNYQDGGSVTSPHGELAISFQPNMQNAYSLNARYGLERSGLDGADSKTLRLGVSYTRVFSSRMSGTITASYLHSEESTEAGASRDAFDERSGGGEQIFDATASLNYRLTSHISLSASITCTRGDAAGGLADPDRNRFVLSAVYEF